MVKILLAEDDTTMVALLKTLLKMEGFEVLALDVEDDIPAAVDREKPDAIFMDVHLGERSGMQVLDAIRKNPVTAGVRVVMTSFVGQTEQNAIVRATVILKFMATKDLFDLLIFRFFPFTPPPTPHSSGSDHPATQ